MKFAFLALAVLLELGSFYFVADFSNSTVDLLYFLALHGVASTAFALTARVLLPEHYREPRAAVLGFLFSFAFFIPLVGLAGILLATMVTLLSPKVGKRLPFAELDRPEYVLSLSDPEPGLRISGLRHLLLDPDAPSEMRLKALIALQHMPGRVSGPMLKKLLGDPSDDIRLVAYGMLDVQEKRINAGIEDELDKLKRTTRPELRQNSLRHAAELYWELIYTGLAQGDVRAHAAAEGLRLLELAQRSATGDAGLWYLRGRLLKAGGEIEAAGEAFSLAISCGLQETRVLPYLAELAFERRDFSGVRQFLGAITDMHTSTMMAPMVRFWLQRQAR